MDRRTAFEALMMIVVWGMMDTDQQTTHKSAPTEGLSLDYLKTRDLTIHLNWQSITVHRGDKSITIDQDELFRALEGK
jgi:hypothetical protein